MIEEQESYCDFMLIIQNNYIVYMKGVTKNFEMKYCLNFRQYIE